MTYDQEKTTKILEPLHFGNSDFLASSGWEWEDYSYMYFKDIDYDWDHVVTTNGMILLLMYSLACAANYSMILKRFTNLSKKLKNFPELSGILFHIQVYDKVSDKYNNGELLGSTCKTFRDIMKQMIIEVTALDGGSSDLIDFIRNL
jgi:hypothetical protein